MKTLGRVTLGVAALAGALGGEAAHRGMVDVRTSGTPEGWQAVESHVPYRLADLIGDLPSRADAWNLDFYTSLQHDAPQAPSSISASVILQEGGQLELWLTSGSQGQGGSGVGVFVERLGEPSATVVQSAQVGRTQASCQGELPPPSDAPYPVAMAVTEGGLQVTAAGTQVTCRTNLRMDQPQVLARLGPATVSPGLRRSQVADIVVDGVAVPPPGPAGRPLWWLLGALAGAGLAAGELRSRARASLVLLTTLPLLLWALTPFLDLRVWAETARVTWLPIAWLPLLLPGLAGGLLKGVHHLGRALSPEASPWPLWLPWAAGGLVALPVALGSYAQAHGWRIPLGLGVAAGLAGLLPLIFRLLGAPRPRRAAALAALTATVFAAGSLALGQSHPLGVVYGGLVGVCGAIVIWANANAAQARAFNLTSLGACILAVALAEGALRSSDAGTLWSSGGSTTKESDIYGWVSAFSEDFEVQEAAQHTAYPEKGYPVAIGRDEGSFRVVAMGGSTTGGAFQNDDLDEFYPARLEELLGTQHHVINQGVGGWTTFQIRRYVEARIDELAPDLLTLYVGHNDLLTHAPRPLEDLFAVWEQVGTARMTSDRLGQVRLYQGLRYGITSLRPASQRVAVPVEHARRNLERIIELVTGQGGRVLLMSEGLAPDPGPLLGYFAMMEEVAQTHENVDYSDVAGTLHDLQGTGADLYLDDCHLTDMGHRVVATQMLEELVEAGLASPTLLEQAPDPLQIGVGKPSQGHGRQRGPMMGP